MKLAFIAPTKYLEQISGQTSTQMALAHEVIKNKTYHDYFLSRSNQWDWVLMDNGAHEGTRILGEELVNLCKTMKPSCVIMPDVLDNADETYKDTMEFYNTHKDSVLDVGTELMAVPQWETFEKYMNNWKAFHELKDVKFIGISYTILFNDIPGEISVIKKEVKEDGQIVQIPENITIETFLNSIESKTEQQTYRRFFLIKYLIQNNYISNSHYYHLLGLANPGEFRLYATLLVESNNKDVNERLSRIRTCDSTLAFGMGVQERIFDSTFGVIGERVSSWEDFNSDIELTMSQKQCIQHNIVVAVGFADLINNYYTSLEVHQEDRQEQKEHNK